MTIRAAKQRPHVARFDDGKTPPAPVETPAKSTAELEAEKAAAELAAREKRDSPLARVLHLDLGELSAPEKLPNGWVRTQGRISRTGIQEYRDGTGKIVRELRLPEEVFDAESMASFGLVPLTNTHPPGLLDDKNAKFYSIGAISKPEQAGEWLVSDLLIHDAEARSDAEAGRSQLSNGYECDLDPTQDAALIAKWGEYDFVQRKIRGNHCALVDVARAGPDARARMDAGSAVKVHVLASNRPHERQGAGTMKIQIGKLHLDATDANAAAIQQAIDQELSDLRNLVAGEKTRADAAEKKRSRSFELFDSLYEIMLRGKKRRDGMKARMMSCDECAGTGKVAGDEGEEKKCDYCDGAGSFRMHDKFGDAVSVEPESEEHGEYGADPTDDDDDMDDADELATERETEESGAEAVGKARGKKDGSSARRAAQRDARKDTARKLAKKAKKDRADSIQRRIDRGVRVRTQLVESAMRFLGPDFKADGKSNDEIRKAVIKEAWPEAKLDDKGDEYLRARFDAACEQLQPVNVHDLARGFGGNGAGENGERNDGGENGDKGPRGKRNDGGGSNWADPDAARANMLKRYDGVHKVKAK